MMPTRLMATGSTYNKRKADYAVALLLACGDGEQATGLVETRKNLKLPEAHHLQTHQQFLSGAFG